MKTTTWSAFNAIASFCITKKSRQQGRVRYPWTMTYDTNGLDIRPMFASRH